MLPPADDALLGALPFVVHWSTTLVDWLLTYAIHSTMLVGVVWLVTASAPGRRARLGYSAALWRLALIAPVATSLLATTGALGLATRTVSLPGAWTSNASYRVVATAHWQGGFGAPMTYTRHVDVRPIWPLATAALWIGATILGGGVLAMAHRRFTRSLTGHVDGTEMASAALRAVLGRARLRRRITLQVTDNLTSPVAIGCRWICLPRRALAELDREHLEGMLAHEVAHLVRRDGTWLLTARMVEAAFFFQPLNRLARRRMAEAAEFAADAWAVAVTGKPVILARCLATVAGWRTPARTLLAPAMAESTPSVLVRRVRHLTAGNADRAPAHRTWVAAMAMMGGLGMLAPRADIGGPAPETTTAARQTTIVVRRAIEAGPGRITNAETDVVVLGTDRGTREEGRGKRGG